MPTLREILDDAPTGPETAEDRFSDLVRALSAKGSFNRVRNLELRREGEALRVLVPGDGPRDVLAVLRPGTQQVRVTVINWHRPPASWPEEGLAVDLTEGYHLDGQELGSARRFVRRLMARLRGLGEES